MSTNIAGSRSSGGIKQPANMAGILDKLNEKEETVIEKVEEKPKTYGDLKKLMVFGKLTEEVSFGEYTFEICTLSTKQQKLLVTKLMKLTEDEKILNIKIFTLSLAITSVNSVPFSELDVDGEFADDFDKKVEILLNMQSPMINILYSKYEDLSAKSRKSLMDTDQIKK